MSDESIQSPSEAFDTADGHTLGTWSRIYLHGLIACLVVYAIVYLVDRLVPLFDFVENPTVAVGLAVLAILVLPPLVGSLILFGALPMLGKREALRGLEVWDDRLLSELSRAKQRTRVVIVNWPSKEVRTMGVLTAIFEKDKDGRQLAAVYVPTAPQTKFGYIRVVAVEDLEFTDWTIRQWQVYQLTFGSAHPPM